MYFYSVERMYLQSFRYTVSQLFEKKSVKCRLFAEAVGPCRVNKCVNLLEFQSSQTKHADLCL